MKYLSLSYAVILAAILVMSPCAQAYSTDTVRKQALMGGLSDGVSKS